MTSNRSLKPYPTANVELEDTSVIGIGSGLTYLPITWLGKTNVTEGSNSSITKTSGAVDVWDAGAYSAESIASGDAGVRMTIPSGMSMAVMMIGLNNATDAPVDNNFASLDYAIFAFQGILEVSESGTVTNLFIPYTTGDVLEVRVVSGQVEYTQNGTVIRTVASPTLNYPLVADCSICRIGNTLGTPEFMATPAAVSGGVEVTWNTRNRLTSGVKKQTDASDAPEEGQTTTIEIYGEDGTTLLRTEDGITGDSYDYTAENEIADTGVSVLQTSLTFKIKSIRDGYESAEIVVVVER
jgi:hypothetical protein